MNKYLLRRIGVASNVAATRPSLADCIEMVLEQSDALVDDILELLKAPVQKPRKPGQTDDVDPDIRHAVLQLLDEGELARTTFGDALHRLVYQSGSQDFGEAPMSRIEDIHVFDIHALEAHIEQALARREVNRSVDDVLPAFNALVSSLLGWTTVHAAMNPLKPEAFVRALQEMLAVCVRDASARSVLLRPAAIGLGIGLALLYRETSDWLRSQGVAPVLAPDTRQVRGGARTKRAETELDRTLAILDKLRSLMGTEPLPGASQAELQDFVHTVPAALVALQDLKLEESMFQRLKRQGIPVLTGGQTVAQAGTAEQPVLARARNRQIGRRLGEEVVRLMFDQLGQDERVPAPVRLQLRPLEPALLRLAQGDPRFFLDRTHPARAFMDRVVQGSAGLGVDDQEAVQGFAACVANAASTILRSPAEAGSFSQGWELLERSWGDFETSRRQQRERQQRKREHEERRIVLAQRFSDALMERFRTATLPPLVAAFLRGPWAQVLAETSLRNDAQLPDPRGYLSLADDLVWSVQRQPDGRDYARLVRLIPRLLGRINEGLVLIRYPQEPVSIFLDDLSALHDRVLEEHRYAISAARAAKKARRSGAAPDPALAPQGDASAPDSGFAGPESTLGPDSILGPDSTLGPDSMLGPDSALDSLSPSDTADVETGAWADLLQGGVWVRARLTWISRNRSLFMFVSGGGLAHAMTRRMMDRLQSEGRLRLGFAPPSLDVQLDTAHGVLTPLQDADAVPGAPDDTGADSRL